MSREDLLAILPLLLLALTPLAVMASIAIRRNHLAAVVVSALGLIGALASLAVASRWTPRRVTGLLSLDRVALVYVALLCAAALGVVLMCHGYFERQKVRREELYVLLGIATLGAAVIVCSSHLVAFFLGLELLTVPLFAIIAYLASRRASVEAAFKYLVLASASGAIMLFGMALLYAASGTLELAALSGLLAGQGLAHEAWLLPGLVLLLVGIGFKLAVVPFHMWTPDVYEAAPAPVTAFIATVSKGAMVGMLVRYFLETGVTRIPAVFVSLSVLAAASMIVGNLLALRQTNLKRILAWSSIAHLGTILVGVAASGPRASGAVTFYVAVYFAAMLGAFGVVSVCSEPGRDAEHLHEYRGLFWRRPALGSAMALCMLSLIGMPLTAGFVGKFQIMAAGASSAIWGLVLVLVVSSAVGLVYYLRVVHALFSDVGQPSAGAPVGRLAGRAVVAAVALVVLWLGIAPSSLMQLVAGAPPP